MIKELKASLAPYFLAGTTLILAILWPFLAFPLLIKILFILSVYIFIISLFLPHLGFLFFIFLRPILDFSTDYEVLKISGASLNLASIYSILFLLFVAITIFSGQLKKLEIKRNNILIFWLAFLAWSATSLLWSFAPASSLGELARLSSFVGAFFLGFYLFKSKKELTDLIKVIILSAFIPVGVAIYQFLSGSGLVEGEQNRLLGTFAHPNMLAFFLSFVIILSVFIGLNIKKTRVENYWYWLLAIIFTIVLFFTYTRGAYLVLLFSISLVGLFKFRKFLLTAFLFLAIIYLISPTVQGRFNSIFQSDPYGSISWRVNLWRDELSYVSQAPVLGQGLGLAQDVIAFNRDWRLGSTEPHNDFLRIAIDTGLIGLGLYLLIIASLLLRLKNNYLHTTAPRLKMINLFILALALSLYALSFGDNILNDSALQWSWWALLGSLLAVQDRKYKGEKIEN